MKKFPVLIAFLLGLVFLSPSAAQTKKESKNVAKAEHEAAKAAAKHKAIDLNGSLRKEGDKTIFVNEESEQIWTIANPDMLLGHEGLRVKIKATPDINARTLLVEEVKDLKPLKQPKIEKASKKKRRAFIF
jgi:hypothetical protein